MAKKKLEAVGWSFRTKNRVICPECEKKAFVYAKSKANEMIASKPQTVARPLSDVGKRAVRDLLLANFDDGISRYCSGWSDERVAKEANAPLASVVAYRDFVFGPLKADPELAAVKSEIEKMLNRLIELSEKVNRIGS